MSVTARPLTAEDLFAMSSQIGRAELVEGELIQMSPAGFEHGLIALSLAWPIARHVKEHRLGRVCAAETGFLLKRNPDTVRAPDLAFISRERVDRAGSTRGYWPGCPDLVAEVISPSDLWSDVEAKAIEWLESGCKVVWLVDPKQKHVTEYRSVTTIRVWKSNEHLAAPDVLGDWSIEVQQIFE